MKYVNHMAKFFACVCLFGSTALFGEYLTFRGKFLKVEPQYLPIHENLPVGLVDDENDATDFTLSYTHREADYPRTYGVVIKYTCTISADIIVRQGDSFAYSQKGYLAGDDQGHLVLIANESVKSAQWVCYQGCITPRPMVLWNPESGRTIKRYC